MMTKIECSCGHEFDAHRQMAHYLACGDSTSVECTDQLLKGEEVRAIVTDPPYGIEREGILNDDPRNLRSLYDGCFAAMTANDAVSFAFLSPRLCWIWYESAREAGWRFERFLWLYRKQAKTYPWHGWALASDAIAIFTKGQPIWATPIEYKHDTYVKTELEEDWLTGLHTTIKPSWVVRHLVENTIGNIYDPFSGSGTTLVACEQTGRLGRACEISPQYVAVALERLLEMGLEPEEVSNAG